MKRRSIYAIDDGALDQESRRHSEETGKYGELKAEARQRKSNLQRRLELIEADLKLRMRKDPLKYDLPKKPPMELIKAAILIHPKYRKMYRRVIRAQNEVDMYAATLNSLHEMGKDIHEIVELHKTNYYTDPERYIDYQAQHEAEQREVRSSMKKRRKRR